MSLLEDEEGGSQPNNTKAPAPPTSPKSKGGTQAERRPPSSFPAEGNGGNTRQIAPEPPAAPQQSAAELRIRKLQVKLAEIKANASETFLSIGFATVERVHPEDAVEYLDVDVPDTAAVPSVAFPSGEFGPQQMLQALLGPSLGRPAVDWAVIGRAAVECPVNSGAASA
jgi:hypothetical protein